MNDGQDRKKIYKTKKAINNKREREREDISARDLGWGDFTFCQQRERERERGGASVKETWPV